MDVFWTLPPVTRTITAAAVLLSAGLYSGLLSGYYYFFIPQFVFTVKMVPQVWRIFTAFLITHPKLGILMDPYLLYMYGSGLETESSRFSQPGDFFVYTGFLCSVIVGLAGGLLGSHTFLHALTLGYAWTYAQDNPTRQVSFFIINFDAKYLPIGLLFMTLIMESPAAAMTQATGLVAAHLYDFLTRIWPTFGGGKNYISTPNTVKLWFGARPGSSQTRSYGSVTQGRPAGSAAADAASARASGRVAGGFDGMGPGRRLG